MKRISPRPTHGVGSNLGSGVGRRFGSGFGRRLGRCLALSLGLAGLVTLAACQSFPYSNTTVVGEVTAIDSDEITLQPGEYTAGTGVAGQPGSSTFEGIDLATLEVGNDSVYTVDVEARSGAFDFTSDYLPTTIEVSGTDVAINGDGASFSSTGGSGNGSGSAGSSLTISEDGAYSLTGTFNGPINVTANGVVALILNDASISTKDAPAITAGASTLLTIASASGTENYISSTSSTTNSANSDKDVDAEDLPAAIDVAGSLFLDGEGFLSIEAAGNGCSATTFIGIEGGSFDISAGNDCLFSFGDICCAAGGMTLTAGDDGIHADQVFVLEGGEVDILGSQEGLEAEKLYLRSGSASIVSDDDGINAAEPEAYDVAEPEGYSTMDSCLIASGKPFIIVNAGGDGLDSNGSIQIEGGVVLVSGSTSGDNSALDYDNGALLNGGSVLFAGSSGMAQDFSTANQPYLMASVSGQADQNVAVSDSEGNVLISFTVPKSYQMILASSTEMVDGTTYSVHVGGTLNVDENKVNSNVDSVGFTEEATVEGGVVTEATASLTGSTGFAGFPGGAGGNGAGGNGAPGNDAGGNGAPGNGQSGQVAPPPDRVNMTGPAQIAEATSTEQGTQSTQQTAPGPVQQSGESPTLQMAPGPAQMPMGGTFTASDAQPFEIEIYESIAKQLSVGSVIQVTFGQGDEVKSVEILAL